MVTMLLLILLPAAFLLPPGTGAGEIIGGREARPHSRPYMAYIETQVGTMNDSCGGFLVAKNFVLTAAHCQAEHITVYLGVHNITKEERNTQRIPVHHQIPHPQFNRKNFNNDIMLLQLGHRARLTKKVGVIPLPSSARQVPPGTLCRVAGWGRTSTGLASDTLREVDVVVLPDTACLRMPGRAYHHYLAATMMCVGDAAKGKDAASGDSGSPLVCRGRAQGIMSWGPSKPPGVYTKIATFLPWIRATMKNLQP